MADPLIPYFPPPTVDLPVLGPTPPFGLLVVIGIVVGWKLALRQMDKRGFLRLDTAGRPFDWVRDTLWWTVLTGMIVAKLFDTVFYSQELSLRTGLSSTGGFLGAAMGYFLYFHRHPQYKHLRVAMADCIVLGLSVAWIFGRMGCFSVHDHKGEFSDFFLAIPFPEGQRHDLGFYEMLFTAAMAAFLYILNLRKWPSGFFIGMVGILYGPVRIFLDSLRLESTDARYAGLTPAQWGSAALTLFGLWMLYRAFAGKNRVEHFGPIVDGEPVGKRGDDEGATGSPAGTSSSPARQDRSSAGKSSVPKARAKNKRKKKKKK